MPVIILAPAWKLRLPHILTHFGPDSRSDEEVKTESSSMSGCISETGSDDRSDKKQAVKLEENWELWAHRTIFAVEAVQWPGFCW